VSMSLRAAVSKPSSLTIVVHCATIISPFAARGERAKRAEPGAGGSSSVLHPSQFAQIEDNFFPAIQSF